MEVVSSQVFFSQTHSVLIYTAASAYNLVYFIVPGRVERDAQDRKKISRTSTTAYTLSFFGQISGELPKISCGYYCMLMRHTKCNRMNISARYCQETRFESESLTLFPFP